MLLRIEAEILVSRHSVVESLYLPSHFSSSFNTYSKGDLTAYVGELLTSDAGRRGGKAVLGGGRHQV